MYSKGRPQFSHQSRETTWPLREAPSTASATEPGAGGGTRSGCCSNPCFHQDKTDIRPWRDAFMGMRSFLKIDKNVLWCWERKYSSTAT